MASDFARCFRPELQHLLERAVVVAHRAGGHARQLRVVVAKCGEQSLEVVLVQAGVLFVAEVGVAHAKPDGIDGLFVPAQRAADDPVEGDAPLCEVLAQPDALLHAAFGELVVVGRTKRGLSMPYEIKLRHRLLAELGEPA